MHRLMVNKSLQNELADRIILLFHITIFLKMLLILCVVFNTYQIALAIDMNPFEVKTDIDIDSITNFILFAKINVNKNVNFALQPNVSIKNYTKDKRLQQFKMLSVQ